MSEAQEWSKERNRLLSQSKGVHATIISWKGSFAGEIGARYIEAASRHVSLLINELKRFDSYSKVEEMRQKRGGKKL